MKFSVFLNRSNGENNNNNKKIKMLNIPRFFQISKINMSKNKTISTMFKIDGIVNCISFQNSDRV